MSGGLAHLPVRIISLGLLVIPTLAIYFPRSLVVPCLIVAAATIGEGWRRRQFALIDKPLAMALAAMLCWSVLSALWALDVGFALRDSVGLAALMGIALISAAAIVRMENGDRRMLLWAAAAGLAVAWAFTTMELVFDGVLLRYRSTYTYGLPTVMKPGNSVAVVLLAPVCAALLALGRPRLAVAMAAAWLAILPFSYSEAARIGAAGLVAAAILVRVWPVAGRRLIGGGLAAGIMAVPLLLSLLPTPQEIWDRYPGLKNSAHHRLAIWHFAGGHIVEHPVIGWGMNSSRVMPGAEDEHVYQRPRPEGGIESFRETNLPLHPHNVAVQWWLELGGIGAALGVAILAGLLRLGGRAMPDPWRKALAAATVVAVMGIFVTAFGAWQSWWLSILALAGMILALASRDAPAS